MALPKWGGVSLFVCSPHIKRASPFLLSFPLSSWQIFRQSGQIFGKKGQKLYFICSLWCFLGIFGDRKGQNTNIFLKSREENGLKCGRLACLFGVSTGCRWCRVQGLPVSSGRVFRCFCPLSCFVFGALLANMALFRVFRAFLARFGVVVWDCVVLVLCVACGAFVCVRG